MKAITVKLASQSIKELADVVKHEIYSPTIESVDIWYRDKHQKSVPQKYHEELDDIMNRGLSVVLSLTNAALRRYVLSTATVEHVLNADEVMREVKRELDATRTTLFEDMLGAVEDTSMSTADNPTFYDDLVCDFADEAMETNVATLLESFTEDGDRWAKLFRDVHDELYAAANSIGIKAYLSDSDNVLFFGEDRDAHFVTGVLQLPKPAISARVDYKTSDTAKFDEIAGIVKSIQWTDDYILTVNGQATHPMLRKFTVNDVIRLYEVEECKG
tara:strand:+ start:3808 stop:4626 length:819 start_codon:yes stop_codon:yes gene_type:complete